jgi:hypothetical protein
MDTEVEELDAVAAVLLLVLLILLACPWDEAWCSDDCNHSIEIVIIKSADKRPYVLVSLKAIFILQTTYHINCYKRSSINCNTTDPITVSGPIFVKGSLYHFIVRTETVDSDYTLLPYSQEPI